MNMRCNTYELEYTEDEIAEMFLEETKWMERKYKTDSHPLDKQPYWIYKNIVKVYLPSKSNGLTKMK